MDALLVLSSIPVVGWRAVAMTTVDFAVTGAYWGLVQGWIPALVASRLGQRETDAPPATRSETDDPPATPQPPTGWLVGTLAAAAVAGVVFLAVATVGSEANRLAIAEEHAAVEAADAVAAGRPAPLGAVPDPAAPGTAPPSVAASPVRRDPSWCTPDEAMLLMGDQDAATGHRVLSIRVMNFSEEPCTVDGYPDLAFADQNGHALDVAITRGSSFMAEDPGAQPVEIPAGGYAIAHLGWDANSTDDALVATKLYAALVAGDERGSWPVTIDITEGSTVGVTAWRLDDDLPPAG